MVGGQAASQNRVTAMKLVIVVIALGTSAVHVRAECVTVTIENQFAYTQTIFIGTAIKQDVIPRPGVDGTLGAQLTETTFAVEDVWKGRTDPIARVRTCGWTVGDQKLTCPDDGLEFAIGERYLVFAGGNPLTAHGCSATAHIDWAGTALNWLMTKPHKKIE